MRHYLIGLLSLLLLSGCSWFISPPSRVDNPVIEGVNYVGITVTNLEQTEQLYRDATEVELIETDKLSNNTLINAVAQRSGVSVNTKLLRGVNAQLLLMQFDKTSEKAKASSFVDANGPGMAHLAFQVIDTTQTYQKILAGGASYIGSKDMMTNPKTHVSYAYVRDPDNIILEIEHVNIKPLNLPKPPKNERRIRHISLATGDMDRLVDFYSFLLETENPRRAGQYLHNEGEFVDNVSGLKDSEIEMAWFQVRNLELEIIQYHNPVPMVLDSPRPIDATGFNMIMFDVTNLESAQQMLLDAGGSVVTKTQLFNGGNTFFGRDPDGNLLGFQTLAAQSPFSAKNFKNNGVE
ncbi:VOC family protein [Paraglaciecola sp. 20A4]|uniref:VOC family protein n=1 Tax=Paraglaciecola sp. 20A4 TaxID=2687288 RepID=UPI00140930CE|nr:VOC family protein [Paraglaciecola sp. 20A4]